MEVYLKELEINKRPRKILYLSKHAKLFIAGAFTFQSLKTLMSYQSEKKE